MDGSFLLLMLNLCALGWCWSLAYEMNGLYRAASVALGMTNVPFIIKNTMVLILTVLKDTV